MRRVVESPEPSARPKKKVGDRLGRRARKEGVFSATEEDELITTWLTAVCRAMCGEPEMPVDVRRIGGDAMYTYSVRVPVALRGLLIGRRGATADAMRHLLRLYVLTIGIYEDVDFMMLRGR